MTTEFTITYDYLCPFARIANVTLVDMLGEGTEWDVTFAPFSLAQNHRVESEPAVWDEGEPMGAGRGVRALNWSLAVRDGHPQQFPLFHRAVFEARHGAGADIDDGGVLRSIAEDVGLDADAVAEAVATGIPMKTLRDEHRALVEDHAVFGVPTFISREEAVFVRFMDLDARDDLERVVAMIDWTNLNEFKRTRIPR
jgi:predicted DsbA family dithiol-disulfide isomerase